MAHKVGVSSGLAVAPEALPSTIKSPKPDGAQKETTPTNTATNQDKPGQNDPADEYGYIVTNQR